MAVQNFVGDAIRGATLVALHNGGGTGWGEVNKNIKGNKWWNDVGFGW